MVFWLEANLPHLFARIINATLPCGFVYLQVCGCNSTFCCLILGNVFSIYISMIFYETWYALENILFMLVLFVYGMSLPSLTDCLLFATSTSMCIFLAVVFCYFITHYWSFFCVSL